MKNIRNRRIKRKTERNKECVKTGIVEKRKKLIGKKKKRRKKKRG
ncbi:hypothetical protein [Clostridioides difficile]|nr:hypothetical protein [Clostridioides difficile]